METINVAIRIRPPMFILEESKGIQVLSDNPPVLVVKERQQSFTFDHIFSEGVKQEQVYKEMVKPLIHKVLEGYNCTVFAYGQTGTGKTYTIGSDSETYKNAGFILRTLDELLENQEQHKEVEFSVSFYEIYNEKVFDLLNDTKSALLVKGFQIKDLTKAKVNTSLQARELLRKGSKNRHVGETKLNRNSSRSHAVFTIYCNVKNESTETEAKLNLVDLAGSESVRKTGNEGSQFLEGVNINKGLFNVGRVINALSTNRPHIPYRQSVVTTILQDSLDKNNFITLVACISPDSNDIYETIQTLQFSQEAKRLKNKPEVNNIIQQYKKANPNVRPTPLKRQNYQPETSSAFKKLKVNNSWTPGITSEAQNELSSRHSLVSMNTSAISSVNNAIPTLLPLTPIVKRCLKDAEGTIMKELQNRITSQLKPELSHIIRREFIQLTNQKRRACSSPINESLAKRLEFDEESPGSNKVEECTFKIPTMVPKKKTRKEKTRLLEDDQSEMDDSLAGPSTAPRRSIRLSMKRNSPSVSPVKRRQSSRLSLKKREAPQPTPRPRQNLQGKIYPTPAPRKNIKRTSDVVINGENYNQYILNLLNTGSQKELQKLPSVGVKTATQIYFYRQLNGEFKRISDLGKMDSWRGNGYQRFLQANCLKLEDDK